MALSSAMRTELTQHLKDLHLPTIRECFAEQADKAHKEELARVLKRLAGHDAIIIDDIGYVQQNREEMEVLFALLADRYERGSVILASNLPFSKWESIFKDPMTTAAAIDRLVHDRRTVEVWHGLPNPHGFEDCNNWLGECNSARRARPGWAEPEIWFRIVHVAVDRPGAPGATYREQAVEIALGPNGAFENGNIGTVTRRVPVDRVVSAVPTRRGLPKPPREPKTPRVVELLRKAIEWQALLKSGEAPNQAAIARREGLTRARVAQVMGMLRLAPEIQQHILSLPETIRRPAISERALRPIAQIGDTRGQVAEFRELLSLPTS